MDIKWINIFVAEVIQTTTLAPIFRTTPFNYNFTTASRCKVCTEKYAISFSCMIIVKYANK